MQFDKDLISEHKELFFKIRELIFSFEGIVENKKERITTYANADGNLFHMRTMPYGVDIGFLKGSKMKDNLNLLSGKSKVMRVLKITEDNQIIVGQYIKEAIRINTQ